jgi:formylmethanofuran dehydrogenase subunit C
MPLILRGKASTTLPIEVEGLRPDLLKTLTCAEVGRLAVPVGNTSVPVGDVFQVEGECADGHLIVEGDLTNVHRLGFGMTSGTLTVRGDAGLHLGAEMTGGLIDVWGGVGDWAGAEMRGGILRVRGQAGRYLGAAYPGSRRGMREGVILVEGPVGDDAGLAMRRGLIAIAGPAGDGLGRAMIAGSVFAFGTVGRRPGAGMKRGTLALFGLEQPDEPGLLPTFRPSCRDRPPFVTLYLRQLRAWGFPVPDAAFAGLFQRYNGDLVERGQGEVLAWQPGAVA